MNKRLLITFAVAAVASAAFAQDPSNTDQSAAKTDQTPATKSFADYQIGMAFDYPTNWVLVEDPKAPKSKKLIPDSILGKKSKKKLAAGKQAQGETLFYVPSGAHTANLEIYGITYDHAPEEFEKNQSDMATLDKKQVVKQWREQILGVPLLLTKTTYEDAAGPEVTLLGLVYSRTPYKMLFRLTAIDTEYDSAEAQLRQVLQTLHTTSGDLPVAEDPNHPLDASAYQNVVNKAPKVLVMSTPHPDATKAKKGEVAVSATVSGQKTLFTIPAGWTADAPAADGTIALHNPTVTGTVTITLASVIDSDPPGSAMLKASAASLNQFNKVDKRNETTDDFSTAGDATDTIWRMGAGANGPLTTCDAFGSMDEFYWLLSYKLAGVPTAAETKAIDDLIDGMSLDPIK